MRNMAVLSQIQTLEVLALPDISNLSAKDFAAGENLRNHPSIKQLAAFTPINISLATSRPKTSSGRTGSRDYAWACLRKAGFTFQRQRSPEGTWSLSCMNQPLSDLRSSPALQFSGFI